MSSDEESSVSTRASSRKGKAKATKADLQDDSSEVTPLLSGSASITRYDGEEHDAEDNDAQPETTSPRSADDRPSSSHSLKSYSSAGWPSIVAGVVLMSITIAIMLVAFFVPAAVEEYAKQAAVLEPTNLSLESITTTGVRARVQANFRLDGSRVRQDGPRRIGRVATWLVGSLGTEETLVGVYLPEYDNILLGTATVPPMTISVTDGHSTSIDIVAELAPGDADGIRSVANQWLEGKLDRVRLLGKADVSLRTGVLPLGTHSVVESFIVEANKMPELPQYNISRLTFSDIPGSTPDKRAVGANVTIVSYNKYPVELDVPELGFEVLVPNCAAADPLIPVALAATEPLPIRANSEVAVDVHGAIEELPESLIRECPGSGSSPLDDFIQRYLHGKPANVVVRGRKLPNSDTPEWIGEILSSIAVPVPFPGRSFDDLIKEFSLTDVDFQLPDPLADPDSEDADPTVSGTIRAVAALPKELNLELNVTNIKATADVFYKKRPFGKLRIKDWQHANSTRSDDPASGEASLVINSRVEDVPLNITDSDVFTQVLQALIFGDKDVLLDIKALVDIKVETALGELVLNKVPTEGNIPVKHLPKGSLTKLHPSVDKVRVLKTTEDAIHIEAYVNVTNPTPYSAHVPFFTVNVIKNGSVIGDATIRNAQVVPGKNEKLLVSAVWEPARGGAAGRKIGVDLISGYLSGENITIAAKTHSGSIPSAPLIGKALSKLDIEVSAPKLNLPSDDPEDKNKFIRDATFHVFSSTATFTLVSPFEYNTLLLEWVNATAYYNHSEPVGHIEYDDSFAVPPGATKTPRLPVQWSADSIGYDAVRRALGGTLKLDAKADVTVRLGQYRETVWYIGKSIGSKIRP